MSVQDVDPVLFFGRKLKFHFEHNDFTQCPTDRGEKGDSLKRPFDLNWNNSCSIKNSHFFGPEKFAVCDKFLLEHKFLALPPEVLYMYIFLEVGHQFFTEVAKSGIFDARKLETLIKPALHGSENKEEDNVEIFADLYAIAKTFSLENSSNYLINTFQMSFAWNDAALPYMIKEKRNRSRRFSTTGFNVNKIISSDRESSVSRDLIGEAIKESYELKHSSKRVTVFDVYEKRYIEDLAKRFSLVRSPTSSSKSRSSTKLSTFSEDTELSSDYNHFLHETSSQAVTVNGTACVGKTTLLRKIVLHINERFDENARIHKASNFGGFSGKDTEQILALQYQLCSLSISKSQYTSIFDRGAYNNLIWRLILALLNTNDNLVDTFVKLFSLISPLTLEIMKEQPTIIIIDTHVARNRRTMFYRNEGGDFQRCQIERYVVAQNLVYGVFATLCNWPLIDIGDFEGAPLPHSVAGKVKELVFLKIKSNIAKHGSKLPASNPFGSQSWLLSTRHKFVTEPFYSVKTTPIDYSVAQNVEIFK